MRKWTQEDRDGWNAWVEQLPARVRPIARQYPCLQCYRDKRLAGAHYLIVCYEEPMEEDVPQRVMMKVAHAHDSTLPGVIVFGFDPKRLEPCNCGDAWLPGDAFDVIESLREQEERRQRGEHD